MEPLGFFLAGALVGAACMWSSCNRARIAADNERRRMEKRESRLIDERNAYQASAERWKLEITDMRIDQANNAGYLDGYNACRRESENQQAFSYSQDFIAKSLRDGKRVSWTVINH